MSEDMLVLQFYFPCAALNLIKSSMRHPLKITDSLFAVKLYICVMSIGTQPTTLVKINPK